MTLALDGRAYDARMPLAQKRALVRLRWAVVAMVLLNAVVWGGMIDVHQLVDQAWAWGAAWLAAMPTVSVTISH